MRSCRPVLKQLEAGGFSLHRRGLGGRNSRTAQLGAFAKPTNPKVPGAPARHPSTWCWRSELISLDQLGCEARKIPAAGFFLLTSTFIELTRAMCSEGTVFVAPSERTLSGAGLNTKESSCRPSLASSSSTVRATNWGLCTNA